MDLIASRIPLINNCAEIDPGWMEDKLSRFYKASRVKSAVFCGSLSGGYVSKILKLKVCLVEELKALNLVLKYIPEEKLELSLKSGLVRETMFYNDINDGILDFPAPTCKVYYAKGFPDTGEKYIIMENLSESGFTPLTNFFDPEHPLFQEIDEESPAIETKHAIDTGKVSLFELTDLIFRRMARFHALNWGNKNPKFDLFEVKYINGVQSLLCNDFSAEKENFEARQHNALKTWNSDDGQEILKKINPKMLAIMKSSQSKLSYEKHVEEFSASHRRKDVTLMHGDFYPGNLMIGRLSGDKPLEEEIESNIILIDFEMIKLGLGPGELAQFLISNATVEWRREYEERLLRNYYNELCLTYDQLYCDIADRDVSFSKLYGYDQCKRDYIMTGVSTWCYFLQRLFAWEYFSKKLYKFCEDHGVTPENVPMPRH